MEKVAHTLSKNFLGITRTYADDILIPNLSEISKTNSPTEITLNLAGKNMRFVFYSKTLAKRMLPAFEHLEQTDSTPDLTINIWDSNESGVDLIQPYHKKEHMCEISNGAQVAIERGFYGVYFSGEESIQIYDEENKIAYFWTHNADEIPGWVIGAPLRAILHWYLSSVGIHLVHGAVVGMGDDAVLLTAKSGSGKSTTALACMLGGMSYVGDDYVALSVDEKITAYSIYNSAKCTNNTLNALPTLRSCANEIPSVDERKSVIYISKSFPKSVSRKMNIKSIFVPSLTGDTKTRLEPVSKVKTLLAMVPTTIFQLPYTGTDLILKLRQMVEIVPCHSLLLGNEIPMTPVVIKSYLEKESI